MAPGKTRSDLTAAQLRVFGARATFEVFEALQAGGPASAAELGPRLDRRPNSLHYHLRKLRRLGLVAPVDSRRSGARTESVYAVTAERFESPSAPDDPELRAATNDAVTALLRLAARDYARAAAHPAAITDRGRHRDLAADRFKAWLPKPALAEVNAHLAALAELFAAHRTPGRGCLCALTTVLTPLRPLPGDRP